MKKVLAFGSFDILHKGHESYLNQAKKHGDYLVVVVARDMNIERFKEEAPTNPEQGRLAEVQKLPMVDEAVLGDEDNIFAVFSDVKPDVVALGYDQSTATEHEIETELKKRGLKTKLVRMKPFHPEIYKSSKLRKE